MNELATRNPLIVGDHIGGIDLQIVKDACILVDPARVLFLIKVESYTILASQARGFTLILGIRAGLARSANGKISV